MVGAFWRVGEGGVTVAVKVQPKSRRPGLLGRVAALEGERLRIGVTEAAEGGRANRAVCETSSEALGVAPRQVSVLIGATSREKTLRIEGDPASLAAGLASLEFQP